MGSRAGAAATARNGAPSGSLPRPGARPRTGAGRRFPVVRLARFMPASPAAASCAEASAAALGSARPRRLSYRTRRCAPNGPEMRRTALTCHAPRLVVTTNRSPAIPAPSRRSSRPGAVRSRARDAGRGELPGVGRRGEPADEERQPFELILGQVREVEDVAVHVDPDEERRDVEALADAGRRERELHRGRRARLASRPDLDGAGAEIDARGLPFA